MKTIKSIWQWLSGSHEEIEEPVYNPHFETVIPVSLMRKYRRGEYIWNKPKPRIGRRKISNIVRYR